MFKHIVMWNLLDEVKGVSKEENAKKLKVDLEALKGKIAGVVDIELGLNVNDSGAACDVVLCSTFESYEDFQAYREHPEHQKILPFVREIASDVHVVDYEV